MTGPFRVNQGPPGTVEQVATQTGVSPQPGAPAGSPLPAQPGPVAPPAGTVTPQAAGPAIDAAEEVTDGSVAAGDEVYGPPIPFESIAALSDEELQALAEKYGIDTSTGGPRGLLVQAIHEQMVLHPEVAR